MVKVTKAMYIQVYGKVRGTQIYNLAQKVGKQRAKTIKKCKCIKRRR